MVSKVTAYVILNVSLFIRDGACWFQRNVDRWVCYAISVGIQRAVFMPMLSAFPRYLCVCISQPVGNLSCACSAFAVYSCNLVIPVRGQQLYEAFRPVKHR